MKDRFTRLLWATLGGLCLHSAHAGGLPQNVTRALAAARIPVENVSVVAGPLDGVTPTVSWNADVPRNPASVIKLVTTLAALEQLGPAYTWQTELLTESPIAGDRLRGPLYLRGSGDPKLTHERLWLLLRQLRDRGVRVIDGDLILDRSAFAPATAGPGEFDGRPLRPYNALPDALLFNFNALSVHLRADDAERAVLATVQPAPDNLLLDNRIKLTQAATCGDWRETVTATPVTTDTSTRLTLAGQYPAVCGERDWYLQAMRPDDLLAGSLRALWSELGGRINGTIRAGKTPETARVIAVSPAPTLSEVVRDINKFSNNVQARQLYLTVGREALRRAGNQSAVNDGDSERAIADWARDNAVELPQLNLVNGSGLARETRVTAGGLANLLRHAWQSPVMPEFMASLPVAAVDGTMRKRGRDTAMAGRTHLKTGSIEAVKALAGYALDTQGRRWLVVFLVNHPQASAAQEAMDALLLAIVEGTLTDGTASTQSGGDRPVPGR